MAPDPLHIRVPALVFKLSPSPPPLSTLRRPWGINQSDVLGYN